MEFPEWLTRNDDYIPDGKRASFIEKNIKGLAEILAGLRSRRRSGGILNRVQPRVKLPAVVFLIFLVSLSRSPSFVWLVSVSLLVLLSVLPTQLLKRILALGVISALFTFVTLLPALLFGFSNHIELIVAKVWLTVSFSGLLALSTSWYEMTGALKFFHMPDLFILILDITLKYIAVLGDFALAMFYALKIRSVGHSEKGAQSLAGIAGTLFLKSKTMADDLFNAMTCRGFTGTYKRRMMPAFHLADGTCFVFIGLLIAAFFYLK